MLCRVIERGERFVEALSAPSISCVVRLGGHIPDQFVEAVLVRGQNDPVRLDGGLEHQRSHVLSRSARLWRVSATPGERITRRLPLRPESLPRSRKSNGESSQPLINAVVPPPRTAPPDRYRNILAEDGHVPAIGTMAGPTLTPHRASPS